MDSVVSSQLAPRAHGVKPFVLASALEVLFHGVGTVVPVW